VDYDPDIVSYKQLLGAFWHGHDATYPPYSKQYRSAVFYTTDEQRELATEYKQAEETRLGATIYTDIEPYAGFFMAEDYHQKYYLRQFPAIVNDLYDIYPDPADFRDSTAAARLDGYIGGYGETDALKKDLDNLGLSESGKQALLKITASGLHAVCPVPNP
jgi:peptide-methionine (S)-S-oxide reductase